MDWKKFLCFEFAACFLSSNSKRKSAANSNQRIFFIPSSRSYIVLALVKKTTFQNELKDYYSKYYCIQICILNRNLLGNALEIKQFHLDISQQPNHKSKSKWLEMTSIASSHSYWRSALCVKSTHIGSLFCLTSQLIGIKRMRTHTSKVYFAISFNRLRCQIAEKWATQF